MKVLDISWPIDPAMTAYKNKKTVLFDCTKTIDKDGARDSTITLSSHTGTHVDAPSHFLRDGKTIDEINPERLIGPCKVLHIEKEAIEADDLKNYEINAGDIILLKTSNSAFSPQDAFDPSYCYLHESGARYLSEKKVKAVGIDYLSIERSHPEHPTHVTLFHHDIVIIEGLRLEHVQPGSYFFVCLPLFTFGLEAAPARAILIESF